MSVSLILAALLVLAVPAASPAAAPPKAPATKAPARPAATRDWSQVVAATPEGGFRMGNPNALFKLVEFGSLTCSHCADFAAEGVPVLVRDYVKRGTLSYEFRNFARDGYDLAAALVATCAPPQRFFPLTEQIFATQNAWLGKFDALGKEQLDGLEKLPVGTRLQRVAGIGGLDALAANFGVPLAKAQACLADAKRYDGLMNIRRVAVDQYGLEGTPTFLINGKTVPNAHNWATLEPYLKPIGQ